MKTVQRFTAGNTEKKVSVVIPAYNCGEYIAEAVNSVFNQTYGSEEIIVVDDGSTDDTMEVLQPFIRAGMVRYFRQENRGPAAARNTGVRKAKGRFVAFLDADDLWDSRKLEKCVAFMEERGFDWICTAMVKVRRNGERFVKRIPADSWALNPVTKEVRQLRNGLFFFSSVAVHTPTIVARRECFDRVGYFDESFLVGEDTDLWLRFEESGLRGGYLDEPLTVYRYNDTSITRGRSVDGLREHVKVARKHAALLGMERGDIRRSFGRFLWDVAGSYHSSGRYVKAARYYLWSMFYEPANAGRALTKIAGKRGEGRRPGEKVKVLFYDPTSGYGGSTRCLVSWLDKLDRRRFDPVVAAHFNGPMLRRIRESGVPVVTVPYKSFMLYHTRRLERLTRFGAYLLAAADFLFYDLPTAVAVYRTLRRHGIRLAHLNSKVTSIVGAVIACRLAGVPCICHLHDTAMPVRKELFFSRWIENFIALTPKAHEMYAKLYPHRRMEVIPNGIDLERYRFRADRAKLRRELGIPQGDRVAGIVGRLVDGKGFDDFLRAAERVLEKVPQVTFIIVGKDPMEDGRYERMLRELAASLEIDDKVVFAGWRENAIEIMSLFDVLVQASSTFPEGFGLTVVEAMALRKPVVATDIPGPSEILVDGVTGVIVPPADPEKMAEAVEKIITDPRLARTMGTRGRRHVERNYELGETVRRLESFYRSLLEENGGPAPVAKEERACL